MLSANAEEMRGWWVFAGVFFCFGALRAATFLDLSTAKQMALKNSATLEKIAATVLRSQEKIHEIAAKYHPTLSFNSEYSLSGSRREKNISRFEGYLQASWLLFDGFRGLHAKRAQRFTAQAKEARLLDGRRVLAASVAAAFYQALNAQEQRERTEKIYAIQQKLIEALNTATAEVKAQGVAVPNNETAEIYTEEEKLRGLGEAKIQAEMQEQQARILLAELLSYDPVAVPEDVFLKKLDCGGHLPSLKKRSSELVIRYEIAKAFGLRRDLKALVYDQLGAGAQVKVEEAARYPRISIVGSVGRYQERQGGVSNQDTETQGGIRFSWDILDGGLRKSRIKQASIEVVEAQKDIEALSNHIRAEVATALSNLKFRFQLLDTRSNHVSEAFAHLKQIREEIAQGTTEPVEEFFAQRTLATLEAQVAESEIEVLAAEEKWLAATASNY